MGDPLIMEPEKKKKKRVWIECLGYALYFLAAAYTLYNLCYNGSVGYAMLSIVTWSYILGMGIIAIIIDEIGVDKFMEYISTIAVHTAVFMFFSFMLYIFIWCYENLLKDMVSEEMMILCGGALGMVFMATLKTLRTLRIGRVWFD